MIPDQPFYGLREAGTPQLQVLIGDGKPVGEPITSKREAFAQAEEQSWLGNAVEIIGSYDRFATFWTVAKFSAKGIDRLL